MVRRLPWGYLACAWSVVFALVHVYWGFGGRRGLDVSAGPALATDRPTWFVAGGLFGVGALLIMAAVLGISLELSAPGDGRARVLLVAGYAVSAVLLVRGIAIGVLMALGTLHAGDGITSAQVAWTTYLWNPWFIIGGVCFLAATIRFTRRR